MAVFFRASDSGINFEVAEYQEFPRPEPEDAPTETPKPKLKHISVVLLSFGLLCVLQGILNISLRLALTEPTDKGETEISVCPEGWIMFGSSCYYISSQRRSWDNSRRDCMQREADLVIITSRQEQAFLTGFTAAAWVGMTDREQEGTWVWVDGTPLDEDMLQWANGQPDGAYGGEDCADLRTMKNFIGLNDFNCSSRNQWICEKALL
ncbi:C-type lectin domain family 4 member M CD209 antigen-like protein 1 [Larimichthys crocea]|uniref:C-type lectin domain family 4 member M CD209 antigen-like protein 1 n=1 Tax=Larimichthys crocea TaxID=215358 RepID=A0A6G0JC25_LARCR|nr:CD209 antigen-like protein E [Larimichthys crocea]KAE8301157.1 C-type lectin domain family 4 member M CD209 antigen-like protein 1 [Larimichthys crocea]